MARKFEPGCYGDGTFGHQHTRIACATVLNAVIMPAFANRHVAVKLIDELRGDMSDDASEEYDACDMLNEHVPHEGYTWGWQDGDFGLWPDEEGE